jgi:hypothetical protein
MIKTLLTLDVLFVVLSILSLIPLPNLSGIVGVLNLNLRRSNSSEVTQNNYLTLHLHSIISERRQTDFVCLFSQYLHRHKPSTILSFEWQNTPAHCTFHWDTLGLRSKILGWTRAAFVGLASKNWWEGGGREGAQGHHFWEAMNSVEQRNSLSDSSYSASHHNRWMGCERVSSRGCSQHLHPCLNQLSVGRPCLHPSVNAAKQRAHRIRSVQIVAPHRRLRSYCR